jgi:hypothetical protein
MPNRPEDIAREQIDKAKAWLEEHGQLLEQEI